MCFITCVFFVLHGMTIKQKKKYKKQIDLKEPSVIKNNNLGIPMPLFPGLHEKHINIAALFLTVSSQVFRQRCQMHSRLLPEAIWL